MTVLYYDGQISVSKLGNIVKSIKNITHDEVIILPKNFDILLDVSMDQLVSIKGIIDTAITLKMRDTKSNLPLS